MALVNLAALLNAAKRGGYAVPAFDVFDIEMALGVLKASEEARSPLIFAYAEPFSSISDVETIAPVLIKLAKQASVPVCIHLDHATNKAIIERAVACGFTGIMIDASDKPFEENVAATKEIVAMCRPKDISVEAEIGHVSGNTGMYEVDDEVYTDAAEAADFVRLTEVDCLAVAIGTVHGVYKKTPSLNLGRCKEISGAVGVPLVLHGGSGLSDDDFRNTIKNGVAKINIFTDLTLAALARLSQTDLSGAVSFIEVQGQVVDAVRAEALKKINLFGCAGKA